VLDEPTAVARLPGQQAQANLDAGERAGAAGRLDCHAPGRRRQMQRQQRPVPRRRQRAEHDEQDEAEVQQHHGVGKPAIYHGIALAHGGTTDPYQICAALPSYSALKTRAAGHRCLVTDRPAEEDDMELHTFPRGAAGAAALLLLLGTLPPASAQTASQTPGAAGSDATAAQESRAESGSGSDTATRRQQAASKRLSDSVGVVRTMSAAPGMPELLARARGVYILPTYARAALAVGASGGAGVLMVRRADGSWGNPVFFNVGGLSIGLQAGAEGGPLALVLLNQKAVDSFRNKNNFSLNADAGLTVINFARMAQGSTSGDVVAWSGTKGLFGNAATVAINDIRYNQRVTEAYYGKPLTALQAIDSAEPNPQADPLRKVLGAK
jgi:lipid-binding SYLF domain-containing protein